MTGKYLHVLNAVAGLALTACISSIPMGDKPRHIDFSAIHKDQSLIGEVIRVRACIGISLSTVVDPPEEFVLLYPCGHKLDESLEKVAIAGLPATENVLEPFVDAEISVDDEVQADLTGKLSKRRIDERDNAEYLVLTIQHVSNPVGRARR